MQLLLTVCNRNKFDYNLKMWTSVVASEIDSAVPSARSKHSATLVGEHVYLLGGRNGNLPMKDFWKYNLGECTLNLFKYKFNVLTITIFYLKNVCFIIVCAKFL